MDLTDTPDDVRDADEAPPDFDAWDSPGDVLSGGSTRERLLDVILQLRDPVTVSTVAERAECDTETARNYLEWFAEMGVVREIPGRPVRYERNESYLRWRQIERIREQYSEEEIVEALGETVEAIDGYREQFGVETPGEVSLRNASRRGGIEAAWKALSEWKTLERRAELLGAARRDERGSDGAAGRIDA